MKEAAGEANLTVVAIILIGVVVAIATPLVSSLMGNTVCRTCCTDAGGVFKGGKCTAANGISNYDSSAYRTCWSNATKDGSNKTQCK